ncbi:MAG: hypothetical protein ACOH18_02560 [Candidatus Saccharimonadaceae bacterium]
MAIVVYNNQISGFTAPVSDATIPWLPFISSKRLLVAGNPRGTYLNSPRETFYWDPIDQKERHLTERCSYLVIGDVGKGKSAFPKISVFEDSAIVNDGHPGTAFGINMREIAGKDEYGMLALFMGAKGMSTLNRRFNAFSEKMGFTLSDHLATAVSIYEASTDGVSPTRHMKTVMRVVLAEMFSPVGRLAGKPSIGRFAEITLSLSKSQAINHIKRVLADESSTHAVTEGFDASIEVDEGIINLGETPSDDFSNIDWNEFASDAGAVASAALNFKAGEFGDIVGGDEPLDMNIVNRFFGLNIAHLDEKVKAFVVEFIMRLMEVAARDRNPQYQFDTELWDEGHGLWNYVGFSRVYPKKLKYKRGDSTVLYQMTQNLQDFGAAKYGQLALNSIKDYGAIIFAGLASPESVAFASEHIELTSFERQVIQNLNPGQYGIKFPGEPVQFVHVPLNPIRRHLIETNIATIEALKKRHAYAQGRMASA